MSDDRHDHEDFGIPDDSTYDDKRHDFEEEESVVVPSKDEYRSGHDDDGLWPAERRLYQIFPHEMKYAGSTRRSKKSTCGSRGGALMM
jgi:hypothetical protein|tara:strand:+ start:9862 stop:10125 length:264 start_codon:yes stop_codon:yes gene_type:complete